MELGLDNTFHRGVPHARGGDVNRSANEQSLDYGIVSWWKMSGALKLNVGVPLQKGGGKG